MALVTLVVIGHAWTLLPTTRSRHLYDFLYAWHIPAFVFVTGYLSRSFAYTRQRLWQLFRTVAVPYVLFECALALFRVYVGGEQLEDLFPDPHWPLWYLAALFFWRLLTPIFRPMWGGVVVARRCQPAGRAVAGDTLDLARVVGLLPFFVLGLKATPERLERLRRGLGRRPPYSSSSASRSSPAHRRWAATEWLYYRVAATTSSARPTPRRWSPGSARARDRPAGHPRVPGPGAAGRRLVRPDGRATRWSSTSSTASS